MLLEGWWVREEKLSKGTVIVSDFQGYLLRDMAAAPLRLGKAIPFRWLYNKEERPFCER